MCAEVGLRLIWNSERCDNFNSFSKFYVKFYILYPLLSPLELSKWTIFKVLDLSVHLPVIVVLKKECSRCRFVCWINNFTLELWWKLKRVFTHAAKKLSSNYSINNWLANQTLKYKPWVDCSFAKWIIKSVDMNREVEAGWSRKVFICDMICKHFTKKSFHPGSLTHFWRHYWHYLCLHFFLFSGGKETLGMCSIQGEINRVISNIGILTFFLFVELNRFNDWSCEILKEKLLRNNI